MTERPETERCADCGKAQTTRACVPCGMRPVCDSCFRAHDPARAPGARRRATEEE